ncbi:MAG TPA: DUF2339 domain-containing protein [Dehalococcoidales bacterium]
MKCPNCQRENEPTSRFCVFCGAILPAPESGSSPEAAETPSGVSQQLEAAQRELRRLSAIVALMNDRLATLERQQGLAAPSATPAPPQVPSAQPASAQAPPAAPARAKPAKPREWEQILGGNWLARIGVVALIIGAAFFLKFAFDNNWLGPLARVILGIVVGLAMVGGGYYWRTKYPTLAQAITGGGVALLYLSIFAAFALFELIPFYPAVFLLLLVSIGSALLALRYNSMALAIIGIFGAFTAPYILGALGPGIPGDQQTGTAIQLLVYIVVVDLGVIALSTFRNWRWFTLLALVSSLAAFGGWYGRFGDTVSLLVSEVGLTVIFLIFVGATTLYHLMWRRMSQEFDYALMVLNAVAYFSISCGLMWSDLRAWMGGFSLVLTLFYGALAYVALRRGIVTVRLSLFAAVIGLLFLTIAIPIQFGDRAWATIGWAAEVVVLTWLGLILRIAQLRWFGFAVFIVMAVRLLFFDTTIDMSSFRPILNERFLAYVVGIAALYLSAYLLWRERERVPEWATLASIFLVAANFFTLWVLSFEIWNSIGTRTVTTERALRSAQNLSLTALWTVYAVILLVIGIARRWRVVRLGALALLAVSIVKVFVYDVWVLERVYRIIAFVGLGVLLLVSAYLYQRYSQAIRGFLLKS